VPEGLAGLSRNELAALGREYLLAGHLIDRAGMPHVLARFGRDAMRDVAIEEWMGASPVYTRRVQRALDFGGDDVATIFKGMQLDIGAPHEFMDFRYMVHDATHGEFWLAHCGALLDVEPLGEDFVVAMCHDIEDPTFDATACATNPRARMRPIHRPPRRPEEREGAGHHPHCHWVVDIDWAADPVPEPPAAEVVARSRAARVTTDSTGGDGTGGGRTDYAGRFDPDFRLEHLSRSALLVALDEVCLQGHVLVHSFLRAIERRFGPAAARELGTKQFTGIAGLTAERLARSRGIWCGGAGADRLFAEAAVAEVLALHPAFHPRSYVDLELTLSSEGVVVSVGDCPALEEVDGWSWLALLDDAASGPLDALVRAVDPRARCRPCGPPSGRRLAWEVVIDPAHDPAPEAPEVTLTKFSRGATFAFSS
jgi:hypothetical protein